MAAKKHKISGGKCGVRGGYGRAGERYRRVHNFCASLRLTTLLAFCFTFISSATATEAESPIRQTRQVYKTVNGVELSLHVFEPTRHRDQPLRSAIVFFHGGGWAFGSPEEFFGACRRYAAKGFVTFSVQYRLSDNADGKNPQPRTTPIECVQDARSALRWIRANAEGYHVDPVKIIVGGQSVGGQLALATAMLDGVDEPTDDLAVSPVPAAVLLYSGTPNTVEVWCDDLLGNRRGRIWDISPAHHVRPQLPPICAFHGEADPIVAFWKMARFKEAMITHGNHFELHAYPNRGHYLGEACPHYARLFDEDILEKTDGFLRRLGFL